MRRGLLIGLLLCVIATLAGTALLLYTQWALERAVAVLGSALPGELRIARLSGRLAGPIELEGLVYADATIELSLSHGRLDWSPAALLRGELRVTALNVDEVVIASSPGEPIPAGPATPGLPTVRLPLRVALEQVQITGLQVRAGAAQAPIVVDAIALGAAMRADRLDLRRLELRAYDLWLAAGGTLRLSGDYPLALHTEWRYAPPELTALAGEGSIEGDLSRLRIAQGVEGGVSARIDGELAEPLSALRWRAQAQIEHFEAQRLDATWPALCAKGEIEAQGDLTALTLAASLRGRVPEVGDLRLALEAGLADGVIDIALLELEQEPSAARVRARGRWVLGPGAGELDLAGEWEGLAWPPTPASAQRSWASPEGRFHVAGTLEGYRVSVDGAFSATGLPPARLEARGTGDQRGLRLERLQLATLGGRMAGTATLAWDPVLRGEIRLAIADIDPGLHWPDWPGRLSADLALQGALDAGAPSASLRLERLGGSLRGQTLAGRAELAVDRAALTVPALELSLGDARLALDGRVGERWDLRWRLAAPQLAALWPEAAGTLSAQGALSGPRSVPHLVGSLQGSALALGPERIGSLSAQLDVDLASDSRFTLDVLGSDLQLGGLSWAKATLAAAGTARSHRLDLDVVGEEQFVRAGLTGGFDEGGRWSGTLNAVDLSLPPVGPWRLAAPAAWHLAPGAAKLERLCLLQGEARLCAAGEIASGRADAVIEGEALPLQRLDAWLPAQMQLDGRAALAGSMHYAHGAPLKATATLSGSAVALGHPELRAPYRFRSVELRARLDATGLAADAELALERGGLRAALQLPGWHAPTPPPRSQALAGALRADDLPVDLITRFFPGLANAQGTLQADLSLGGRLEEPRVVGQLRLDGGAVEVPALGLRVKALEGRLVSADGLRLRYDLSAVSGDGRVRLHGQTDLRPRAGWPTRVSLTGEDVEVANLPEALVLVSPNLTVTLAGREVSVEGEVAVPRARLRPRQLPEGVVRPSRDVVVVGEGAAPPVEERWRVDARVRVTLGQRVDFDGFGLRGRLVGNLLLIDEPGKLTVGQGELGIEEGVYQMRGQDLTIRRGRLIFANSLVDDPGLDVEAIREVGEVTAGVRVAGTLKRPELTIFSEPAMAEADALAYLLIGRPLSQASAQEGQGVQQAAVAVGLVGGDLLAREVGGRLGLDEIRLEAGETAAQTALVMGKYLTPELYVRYLTGIVEASSIVQLRYQLSRRIEIQTEGGYRGNQSVTGGDIFYTFEH